ncbi:MAG: large conductance mechanosensitive channel protein MscL [Eubacteriaceae bacterium]|nr:large conductance mechanosensitive channel protein MscL [Eubacteriaceae bacterium]MBR2780604.1 large conductance mechanosensitive channel protein MscL [Eubacteriaceae bacterium]MCR4894512.1 large conductance mechanosensitive channel protein MscL [Eubacteriales bacterium]
MKKFIQEFKEFAVKGNVMDMAVGIIIGGAFTAIVTSLVNDIISPLIGVLVKMDFNELTATILGVEVKYGAFIMAVVNFLIVALVLFSIIKAMNKASELVKKKEEEAPEAPTTKVCPYCKSEIAIDATRCPHCTSEL